jgi:hypothetical protein
MGVMEGIVVAAVAAVLNGILPAWSVADFSIFAPQAGKELNGLLRPAIGPPARPSLVAPTDVRK